MLLLLLSAAVVNSFLLPSTPPSPRRQSRQPPRPLPATFYDDEGGSSSSNDAVSNHPMVVESTASTAHMVVGAEGATISPLTPPDDAASSTSAVAAAAPPAYTAEEEGMVEAKLDKMLARKIDLWPPEDIFELLPLLMKSTVFEWALAERLDHNRHLNGTALAQAVGGKERKRLEHSRSFLASLKYSEQQRLARQWIEGLLETATESTEAMDEKVFELVEYENQALVGPVLEALDAMLRRLQEMSPDEKTLTQVVIETLKKRVEAEVKTREMPFVRLLALLLRLESAEERERVLRTELRNSRVIDEFAAYVEEGADYVARLRLGPYTLPDNTPEEMMKILGIVRGFTGASRPTAASTTPLPTTPASSRSRVIDVQDGSGAGGEGLPPPS